MERRLLRCKPDITGSSAEVRFYGFDIFELNLARRCLQPAAFIDGVAAQGRMWAVATDDGAHNPSIMIITSVEAPWRIAISG
jgi:hypothetical protein